MWGKPELFGTGLCSAMDTSGDDESDHIKQNAPVWLRAGLSQHRK